MTLTPPLVCSIRSVQSLCLGGRETLNAYGRNQEGIVPLVGDINRPTINPLLGFQLPSWMIRQRCSMASRRQVYRGDAGLFYVCITSCMGAENGHCYLSHGAVRLCCASIATEYATAQQLSHTGDAHTAVHVLQALAILGS